MHMAFLKQICGVIVKVWCMAMHTIQFNGSEVAEWLAHWLLVLEVPGSIPASGEENLLFRTHFPLCHLQE